MVGWFLWGEEFEIDFKKHTNVSFFLCFVGTTSPESFDVRWSFWGGVCH